MSNNQIKIMAHLVAGYPNRDGFCQAAKGLKDGGADILELQIPFSDPTADGPIITYANEEAIRNGFKVCDIFKYIEDAKKIGFNRIIVMTYANIPFSYGIQKYVSDMKQAGVEAVLAPDLPIDDEEGFYQSAFDSGLIPMPVVVINMSQERLKLLKSKPFSKVYVALRAGITGQSTDVDQNIKDFLFSMKEYEIFAGFGIRSADQIQLLSSCADVAVVGSYFTQTIKQTYEQNGDIYQAVKIACQKLIRN